MEKREERGRGKRAEYAIATPPTTLHACTKFKLVIIIDYRDQTKKDHKPLMTNKVCILAIKDIWPHNIEVQY